MNPGRYKEWYVEEYKTSSIKEISRKLNISYTTVYRDFKKFGLKTRTRKEWLKLRPNTYSDCLKKNWSKLKYRDKMSKSFQNRWDDKGYRAKMERIAQEKWEDPEFRQKMEKVYSSPDYRNKLSRTLRKVWDNEEYRNKMAIIRKNYLKVVSSYAKTFYNMLNDLNIKYHREYNDKPNDPETVIGPYHIDCVIPRDNAKDLLVEIQGPPHEIWPDRIIRDRQKHSYLTNRFSDKYELKYLWYHEFGRPDRIVELIKYWTNKQHSVINYSFSDLKLQKADRTECKILLGKYHYLPHLRCGGYLYGAYLNDKLIAVCVFSAPVRQNIAPSFGLESKQVRELSRFCVHPNYQRKNLGSWMISRCLRLLKTHHPECQKVISYCDKTFNHHGSLYKACNFYLDKIIPSDYWYVNSINGWAMHKRTLLKKAGEAKMKEPEFAISHDYVKVYGKEKYRFVYDLSKNIMFKA